MFIIESLLISQHGADFYDAYFTGNLRADDPRMLETLETALRLLEYAGSEEVFVYTCNTFSLPKRAKNEAGARRLLRTMLSAEGQGALGRSRTSLPSRVDIDVDPNDQLQVNKQRLWRSGRLVLAQSGVVPPQFAGDLNQALKDMARERRPSPAIHTLRARYPLLSGP